MHHRITIHPRATQTKPQAGCCAKPIRQVLGSVLPAVCAGSAPESGSSCRLCFSDGPTLGEGAGSPAPRSNPKQGRGPESRVYTQWSTPPLPRPAVLRGEREGPAGSAAAYLPCRRVASLPSLRVRPPSQTPRHAHRPAPAGRQARQGEDRVQLTSWVGGWGGVNSKQHLVRTAPPRPPPPLPPPLPHAAVHASSSGSGSGVQLLGGVHLARVHYILTSPCRSEVFAAPPPVHTKHQRFPHRRPHPTTPCAGAAADGQRRRRR